MKVSYLPAFGKGSDLSAGEGRREGERERDGQTFLKERDVSMKNAETLHSRVLC